MAIVQISKNKYTALSTDNKALITDAVASTGVSVVGFFGDK